ncbi:hypothetical protein [Streptomyces sp. NPDC093149]|uniref:hypothetical protein n=1 Tax=Streptomyces sp. NPDC093149 TaxID=3366031 RepID=UPI0037F310A2
MTDWKILAEQHVSVGTALAVGELNESNTLIKIDGGFGFLSAILGMYGAFAGLVNGTRDRHPIPTRPDPGRSLEHLAHNKPRPTSDTASTAGHPENSS